MSPFQIAEFALIPQPLLPSLGDEGNLQKWDAPPAFAQKLPDFAS